MIIQNLMKTFILLLTFISFTLCVTEKETLYDLNNSSVMNLNAKNFHNQITSNRSKNIVSIIHFYKPGDGKSRGLKISFEKFATEYNGMYKVTALNCQLFMDICEKNEVKEFPSFKVYPPIPAPIMDYEVSLLL